MKKNNSIIYSTLQVTIVTFVIKLLGLIKQSVLASICGATNETDVFFIATGVLVSLSSIIFSAISISLLTMHTNRLINVGRKSANNLINATLRIFIPISLVITVLFSIFAKEIGHFLAPSYDAAELLLLAKYIRLMSVSFILWCYYLIINVVLETDKRFMPGRFQGFFQNVFIILGALILYPKYGIDVLVYAFVLSGVAQCILVTWCARKQFKFVFYKIDENEEIAKLVGLAFPLIVGSAIYEINDIVDKQISTGLGAGSASFLTYGSTINEIVTGVIVTSISTVLFSHFASWVAEGDNGKVEENLKRVLSVLTIIIYPIMIMCLVSGDQIVNILYGRGNFGNTEIDATYGVVVGYAIGFIFQAARANMVKVYYAYQDTKTPMINGAISVAINIILSIILSRIIGISGVALATSIAMIIVSIMLGLGLKRYLPHFNFKEIFIECFKGLIAGIVAAFLVFEIKNNISINKYMNFFIEGLCCIACYSITLTVLKSETITEGWIWIKSLKHKQSKR